MQMKSVRYFPHRELRDQRLSLPNASWQRILLSPGSVMHFDVLPEVRMGGYGVRLLKAFEQWAKNRHAVEIFFGVNSDTDTDTVGRFARKMGYRKVGENFIKGAA